VWSVHMRLKQPSHDRWGARRSSWPNNGNRFVVQAPHNSRPHLRHWRGQKQSAAGATTQPDIATHMVTPIREGGERGSAQLALPGTAVGLHRVVITYTMRWLRTRWACASQAADGKPSATTTWHEWPAARGFSNQRRSQPCTAKPALTRRGWWGLLAGKLCRGRLHGAPERRHASLPHHLLHGTVWAGGGTDVGASTSLKQSVDNFTHGLWRAGGGAD